MERAHRQLSTRLADALRIDDAHRLAVGDERSPREVASVTQGADAAPCLAGQGRAHVDLVDTGGDDAPRSLFGHFVAALRDDLARLRLGDVRSGPAADNPLA